MVAVERTVIAGRAFDLDVERTYNFLANQIVTHNSIYSFREAERRNVLEFAQRYPEHARILLAENFRSRAEILETALACVATTSAAPRRH